ncbi:YhdP family protein [Psychromonas sp. 14N.309.X.WAT.B.A12]|uniref:YhdP family protein n=1 Tax=Psychromonas sp. 14N.309.X.WAT.B.A12 TaxID=2998322 RepID=UPI0025B1781B|nr:YhdP family protein [Psychromonas sp. 14N.309.X.WAT.B.A12]MDN2663686.1 YhdP family protein [Psychromonas sp. 14N.309.X.WAT.B.A12]
MVNGFSFLKHFTLRCLKCLIVLLVVTLIVLAVLLTAARFAINGVEDYKAQLVEWVAAEHDINVDADKVSAGIDFSGLVLTLNNVTFTETDVLPFELKINNLFLHLDFLESLQKQQLIFNDISIKGADLLLKSALDVERIGQLSTSESDEAGSQGTLASLKNILLLRLSSFSITESRIRFTDHLYNQKTILIQDLSWLNDGQQHQGVGKASLPNTLGENTLEFIIDVTGDAEGTPDNLVGRLYAQAENLNATEYLKPQINPLADLTSAVVSFRLWSDFDVNGFKNMQLHWDNSEIAWTLLGESESWQINDGLFQFSYDDQHWLFDSYDLNITHNYTPLNDVNIAGHGDIGRFGQFDLKGININAITPFGLLFSSLSEQQINYVADLELGGKLSKLDMHFNPIGQMTVSAHIDDFSNQAHDIIPGVSNANIKVTADQDSGHASILLDPQRITFDGQFNRSMPLQKADIDLHWKVNSTGVTLASNQFLLDTDDLKSTTQFSLFLPNNSDDLVSPSDPDTTENEQASSPYLRLYSYASLNDASKAQHYFPVKAMGKDVFSYLQSAIQQGSADGAKVLWNGPLNAYPFKQQEGIFQAFIPIKNAQYDFFEEWQGLYDLDLDLLFENDSLLMESEKAKLGSMKVDKLSAKIATLSSNGGINIEADIDQKADSIMQYLLKSPIKDSLTQVADTLQIQDNLQGKLTLNIPFSTDNGQTQVKGQFNLDGNDVNIKLSDETNLLLENTQGSFSFTDENFTGDGLTAKLFDQPVNFSFSSNENDSKYQLLVSLFGQWDMSKLSREQPSLLPLQLSGNLDWQGQVNFSQQQDKYKFGVYLTSPLQGTKINLPAPYNKNALQSWPTKVNVNGDADGIRWDALISNKLKSAGELYYPDQQTKLKYFYLGLGNDLNLPIDKSKQIVRINESRVNLTPWVSVIKEHLQAKQGTDDSDTLFNLDHLYLDVKHAELFEQPIVNLSTDLQQSGKKLAINVKGDDLLANLEYRKGVPDRYDINIQKMNFQSLDMDALKDSFVQQESATLVEPSDNLRLDYPEVFLECVVCIYNQMSFSPLKAHVFPSKSRYNIDYVQLGEEQQATNISGVWDQRRTNIIFDAKGSSQTNIVRRLGYKSPMNYQESEVNGALNWVGAPWQFNFDSLNGDLTVDVEDGQITEVDDKGARLLSFLSLDAIRRSLNIEFDNVFSKGLGFDTMSLSATITNGIFKNDDYFLDGSAGKISGTGLIDLPNLNVNYRFSYSPAVTSSLPVLAAFAINPLTGAAVLMLTKILEPVVDTIVRVDFSAKGPISDPKITIEDRLKGSVKLQNSEVLEKLEDNQANNTTNSSSVKE